MPTIHLLIKGKVQGVFYRASAREEAEKLGVTGWIRNTPGGDVEALVSGDDEKLKLFVDWCKIGARRARVDEVTSRPAMEQVFQQFLIVRGA